MTGIILLDKQKDITSFGAVARVRRICGEKKCGHTGTLDPMATGVLTVMLGGATRFIELLPSHNKAYCASFRLGTTTDTLDITGKVLETREVNVTAEEVKRMIDIEYLEHKKTEIVADYIRRCGPTPLSEAEKIVIADLDFQIKQLKALREE